MNASLFARVLGDSWLGYAAVNWYGRNADAAAQRAVPLAVLRVAVTALAASAYLAFGGGSSARVSVWALPFAAFAVYPLASGPRTTA